MKNILVTGARGFIGSNLVKALRERNYSVVEFSGDVKDKNAYSSIENTEFDRCFHLAGKSFVPHSWENPAYFIENNVYGTECLLEFCRKKKIAVTFISSYLYGTPHYLPIDEKHPVQTPNPYALSKYLAEEICRFYSEYYKLKICVLRPFNVYGPGQDPRFLIPLLINQFCKGSDAVTVKDMNPKRDYVYISDLIEALIATIKVEKEFGVYNIGSGESFSVGEVIEEIKKLSGRNNKIVNLNETRANEIPDTKANIAQAREELKWEPKIKFSEGLKQMLKDAKVSH